MTLIVVRRDGARTGRNRSRLSGRHRLSEGAGSDMQGFGQPPQATGDRREDAGAEELAIRHLTSARTGNASK